MGFIRNQNQGGASGGPSNAQGLPAGGTIGQALLKSSNADFDADWVTPNNATTSLSLQLIQGVATILIPGFGISRGFHVSASEISQSAGGTVEIRMLSGSSGPFYLVIEKSEFDNANIVFPGAEFVGFKPDFSQPGKTFGIRGIAYAGNKLVLAADQTDPAPFAGGNTSIDPLSTSPLAWFDATAENTLFSDVNGTTPTTANGGAVRRWLDLSAAGNHLTVEVGLPVKTSRGVEFNVGGESGMRFDSDISSAQNVYAVLNHNKGGAQFTTLLSAGLNSDRYNVRTDNSNFRSNPNNNANSDDWVGTYRINDIPQTSWKENERYLFSAVKGNPKATPNYFRSLASPSFAGRQFRGRVHELIICGPVTPQNDVGLKQYLANKWNLNI